MLAEISLLASLASACAFFKLNILRPCDIVPGKTRDLKQMSVPHNKEEGDIVLTRELELRQGLSRRKGIRGWKRGRHGERGGVGEREKERGGLSERERGR